MPELFRIQHAIGCYLRQYEVWIIESKRGQAVQRICFSNCREPVVHAISVLIPPFLESMNALEVVQYNTIKDQVGNGVEPKVESSCACYQPPDLISCFMAVVIQSPCQCTFKLLLPEQLKMFGKLLKQISLVADVILKHQSPLGMNSHHRPLSQCHQNKRPHISGDDPVDQGAERQGR